MIQTVENIGEKLVSMLTYDASQPLIFSSGLFLFLFAGFLFFYGFTRRAPMARIVYVILFSLYFYYKSSGIYFLLLVFASVSDYWIAHAIYKVRTQRAKYWLVGLSVLVNLGMLGYFKYTNFLIEIANNLKKNGGFIPGFRPGKPTSDFITRTLNKITLIGAIFLAAVAVLPIILGNLTGMSIQLGGTSLLIVVGVALDTTRSLDSFMTMRNHKGFLG